MREEMALQLRRTSPLKVRLVSTLIMAIALVAQPFYGIMAAQVASAMSTDITNIVLDSSSWTATANTQSAKIEIYAKNVENKDEKVDPTFLTVTVSSDSTTGRFAKTNNSPLSTANTEDITFPHGDKKVSFYYKDSTPGNYTLTAVLKGAGTPAGDVTATHAIAITSVAVKPVTNTTQNISYDTLADAVNAANQNDVIALNDDITLPVNTQINVAKKITLRGNGHTLRVSGESNSFRVTGAGTVLESLNIIKTDNVNQDIIFINTSDVTVDGVHFTGQYDIGGGEVTRAFVLSGDNFTIKNSSINHLRQPAYINGFTGTISNTYLSDSKGWVVTGNSNVTFVGNTWGTNASNTDIAIIDDNANIEPTVNNYDCTVTAKIISENNNAKVDNQLIIPACTTVAQTTVTVTPENTNGWVAVNDNGNGGNAKLEDGPAGGLGRGSLSLKAADSSSDLVYAMNAWNGTKLRDLYSLSYKTYNKTGTSGPIAFAINFDTDVTDANNSWQGRLTYEPTYAGTTKTGEWQSWDNIMTDRAWWFSSAAVRQQLNCDDTAANLCTLAQIVNKFPQAGFLAGPSGAINLRVDGSWADFDGNVDALHIATASSNVLYDFEPTKPADTTAPSVPTLQTPVDRGYSKTNDFYFNWSDSTDDNLGVTYEFQSSLNPHTTNGVLDTSVWQSGVLTDSTIHSTGAPDGTWYWQVRAIDAAGNKSAWTKVWKMTLDTAAPAGSITSPANGSYVSTGQTSGKLTVKGAASDNLGLNRVLVQLLTSKHGAIKNNTVYLSGTSQDWSTDFDVKALGLSNGKYAVVASFTDNAGHVYKTEYVDFTLDSTAPVLTAQLSKTVFSNTTDPTLTGTITDQDSNIDYMNYAIWRRNSDGSKGAVVKNWTNLPAADGAYDEKTEELSVNLGLSGLSEGSYIIGVRGYDLAGNKASGSDIVFAVDNTAPTIEGLSIDKALTNQNTIKVNGTISDTNLKDYNLRVYSSDKSAQVTPWTGHTGTSNVTNGTLGELSVASLADGEYWVRVWASDLAGNQTGISSHIYVPFTIDRKNPTVLATLSTSNFTIGSAAPTVKVTANDTTSGIDYVEYKIMNADDSTAAGWFAIDNNVATAAPAITKLSAGTYVLRARAFDNAGNKKSGADVAFKVSAANSTAGGQNPNTPPAAPQQQSPASGPVSLQSFLSGPRLPAGSSNVAQFFPLITGDDNASAATPAAPADDKKSGDVLGTEDKKGTPLTDTASVLGAKDGKVFGLVWYWWLLVLAAIVGAWLLIAAAIRRRRGEEF